MEKRSDAIHITVPATRYTPLTLAKKVHAAAILESASFSRGKDRYSILMCNKAFDVIQDDNGVAFVIDGRRVPYNNTLLLSAPAYTSKKDRQADILDALKYIALQNDIKEIAAGCVIPLPSSGVGYLGYEFCARCDTIKLNPQVDALNIAESHFIVGHIYIVFDHFTEKLHIFALNYTEHQEDLSALVNDLQAKLTDLDFSYLAPPEKKEQCITITNIEESKREYCSKVESLKREIVDGNIMQAVPSRRLQLQCSNSALEIYRRLREVNPSPYLIYLDLGDHQLVGSSPESLVRVRGGVASIRPIAGTRKRGSDKAQDESLKNELLSDKKERAEHLMLVDLARNDLGRVCKAGSVEVTRFMDVELFSHVMHITSEVEGAVLDNIDSIDVLRSAFPAGTVSGSPKIAAIEILSRLENIKRRFYAGAVGYIQSNGDLDFCIAIRTALKQGNIWSLQAGGGIVYDSVAEREWDETCEKLGALVSVLNNE